MISDVLADAVDAIDDYLRDTLDKTYSGRLRVRIIACRNEMDAIRAILDAPLPLPPPAWFPTQVAKWFYRRSS